MAEQRRIVSDLGSRASLVCVKEKMLVEQNLKAQKEALLKKDHERLLAYQKTMQAKPRVVDLRGARVSSGFLNSNAPECEMLQGNVAVKVVKHEAEKVLPTFDTPYRLVPREFKENGKNNNEQAALDYYVTKQWEKSEKRRKFWERVHTYRWQMLAFVFFAVLICGSIKAMASVEPVYGKKKAKIMDEASVAAQYFLSGKDSILENDFSLASYKFKIAGERFFTAQKQINFLEKSVNNVLEVLPVSSSISSGVNLLEAGGNIAYAAENLSNAFESLKDSSDVFAVIKGKPDDGKKPLTRSLVDASEGFGLAQYRLNIAENNLEKVDPEDFDNEQKEMVRQIKSVVPQLKEGIDYYLKNLSNFLEILGHYQPKKYMFIFENPREIRPTGGFIGTYGLVSLKEGKIADFKVQSSYAISGQLREKYKAPEPLRLVQSRYNFHDVNWFFDFPTSAQQMILFAEKAGWPTTDGVLAITANIMPELLKVTGPISMPEYGIEINADNFFDEIQREVEINYDKQQNEPKKVLADMLPKLIDKISELDKNGQTKVLEAVLKAVAQKDVLVYFSNEDLEKIVQDLGFGGEVKNIKGDYFSFVATNIGGGKTDHAMEYNVTHNAEIQPDGTVIDTVKLEKKHNGSKNDFWTCIKNMSFMRFYVPEGAELLSAEGFDSEFFNPDILLKTDDSAALAPIVGETEEKQQVHEVSKTRIYKMEGKTVFANWSGLEVGQSKAITLKYKLPFKITLRGEPLSAYYSLVTQKQSGLVPFNFNSTVLFPEKFSVIWKDSGEGNLSQNGNTIKYETAMTNDRGYGIVFNERSK